MGEFLKSTSNTSKPIKVETATSKQKEAYLSKIKKVEPVKVKGYKYAF